MKKANHKTDRNQITSFQQIINVGPETEGDFRLLGFSKPRQLIGRDPWQLYRKLCVKTKTLHDPCVLDVFLSTIDYMNGNPPAKWWAYTKQRKAAYSEQLRKLSASKTFAAGGF